MKQIWPYKNEITLRVQSVDLKVYTEQLFDLKLPNDKPNLSLQSERIALNFSLGGVPAQDRCYEEKLTLAAQIGTFEINTFHASKNFSMARPRQLTPMLIRQDVLFQGAPSQPQSRPLTTTTNTPYKPLSSLASAAKRVNNPGGNRNKNASALENPIVMRHGEYGQHMSQQVGSLDQPVPFDEDKVAMLNNDPDLQLIHNLPNITSPGRLITGPKLASRDIKLQNPSHYYRQRSENTSTTAHLDSRTQQMASKQQQQQPELKKSSSKDSLMSNMLQSVTNFFVKKEDQKTETTK